MDFNTGTILNFFQIQEKYIGIKAKKNKRFFLNFTDRNVTSTGMDAEKNRQKNSENA